MNVACIMHAHVTCMVHVQLLRWQQCILCCYSNHIGYGRRVLYCSHTCMHNMHGTCKHEHAYTLPNLLYYITFEHCINNQLLDLPVFIVGFNMTHAWNITVTCMSPQHSWYMHLTCMSTLLQHACHINTHVQACSMSVTVMYACKVGVTCMLHAQHFD